MVNKYRLLILKSKFNKCSAYFEGEMRRFVLPQFHHTTIQDIILISYMLIWNLTEFIQITKKSEALSFFIQFRTTIGKQRGKSIKAIESNQIMEKSSKFSRITWEQMEFFIGWAASFCHIVNSGLALFSHARLPLSF